VITDSSVAHFSRFMSGVMGFVALLKRKRKKIIFLFMLLT